MTLLFMDGFDVKDAPYKWSVSGGGYSGFYGSQATHWVTGRTGAGYAIQISNYANQGPPFLTELITASSKVFVGFGFAIDTSTVISSILNLLGDAGATTHLALKSTAFGGFALYRGASLIASTANYLFTNNVWKYVEVSATISATVGAVTVKMDGSVVLTFTGNTKNGGTNTTIDTVTFIADGAPLVSLDDIYICNDQGSVNNTFLGDVRVQALLPNGAGSSTQWAPLSGANYTNVNTVPPNVATYVSDSTPADRDTYALEDCAAGTGTIYGVQSVLAALKSDAGSASVKAAYKSGGTVYYDAPVSLGTSVIGYTALRENDPATSAAWTVAAVNALEFGAEVI